MTQQDLQSMVVCLQCPGGIQLIVCLLGKRLYEFFGRTGRACSFALMACGCELDKRERVRLASWRT